MVAASRTAVITGSSGYVGSRIVATLSESGWSTVGFDLEDPGNVIPDRFVSGDVRDASLVQRAMQGADLVVHAAALVPLAGDTTSFHSVNVAGSAAVARSAATTGVRALVNISSSAVYGRPARLPVTTSTPTGPVDPYGWSKLAAEGAVNGSFASAVADGAVLRHVRPRTVVGPGRGGIFALLFDWVARGSALPVLGASTTIQLVDADDLAAAVALVADPGFSGRIVNVGTPWYQSLSDDLVGLCRHAGTGACVVTLPAATARVAGAASAVGLAPLAAWHTRTYAHSNYVEVADLIAAGWSPTQSNLDILCRAYDAHNGDDRSSSVHRRGLDGGVLDVAVAVLSRWPGRRR
jgi:nucleoside-diphosphate-sugar epimerase